MTSLNSIYLIFENSEEDPSLIWRINVNKDGFAEVNIMIHNTGSDRFWILLPCDEVSSIIVFPKKDLYVYEKSSYNYFYCNYSINMRGADNLLITYGFEMAAFIEDYRAFLLTPKIIFSDGLVGDLIINLEGATRIFLISPIPRSIEKSEEGYLVNFKIPLEKAKEVWISYQIEYENGKRTISYDWYNVIIPKRYYSLVELNLKNLTQYKNELEEIFGFSIKNLSIRFFIPANIDDPLGYTFLEGKNASPFEINVNLLTLRYPKGQVELTILHEILHLYLWKAGVDPSLRWFHEGVATFFSLNLLSNRGFQIIEDYKEMFDFLSSELSDLSFVKEWRYEKEDAVYYSASYKIILNLNSTLGINFFKRLFSELYRNGVVLTDDEELFDVMGRISHNKSEEILVEHGLKTINEKTDQINTFFMFLILISLSSLFMAILFRYSVLRARRKLRHTRL